MARARRVLLVEPNGMYAAEASAHLRNSGHDVASVPDAESALRKLAAFEPDTLLLAAQLPGKDSSWFLRRLRDDYMGARPRVLLLADPSAVTPALADLGLDAVILKPMPANLLVGACADVESALPVAKRAEIL